MAIMYPSTMQSRSDFDRLLKAYDKARDHADYLQYELKEARQKEEQLRRRLKQMAIDGKKRPLSEAPALPLASRSASGKGRMKLRAVPPPAIESILKLVRKAEPGPISPQKVIELAQGTMSGRLVRVRMARAAKEGWLQRLQKGLYMIPDSGLEDFGGEIVDEEPLETADPSTR